MPLDIRRTLEDAEGKNYELHERDINPQFVKMLRTIGYDRCYTRASGPYLWDVGGKKYLDFLAGYGVFNVGRNHPDVRRALVEFMELDYASLAQMEAPLLSGLLAAELKERVAFDLGIVYFTSSGTEGVETAIKFARCATGRPALLYCENAFHGLTTGALSLNGCESFRAGFAPFLPECRRIPFDDLEALENALRRGDVAAFFVEPLQGKGVNIPRPGYLAEASRLCHRYGALFVADEVQSGMGRTGKFLAIEHDDGVDPDIVVLSKALSGGYVPVGAVLTRESIYEEVFSGLDRSVVHSSTFGQGSLAMVAGLATLKVMDESNLIANVERMGQRLKAGLDEIAANCQFVKDVRQRGLMVGIELGKPHSFGLKTAWDVIHRMDRGLFTQAVTIPLLDDHHVLTQVAGHDIDVVKLLPPLVIGEEDVRWFLEAFERVMEGLHRFPGPVWDLLTRLGKIAVTARARRKAAWESAPSV